MPEFVLRPMIAADLPAVLAVQAQCYGSALLEGADALASRLALSPTTCWVAALPHSIDSTKSTDSKLAAYLFTHAWPAASLPPWNGLLARAWTDDDALTWFVHDMAVAPVGRGAGLAAQLYEAARGAAIEIGLTTSRLIAVQSAGAYWRRLGYAPIDADMYADKLATYGDDALLMGCRI
nr:GNAT family N-acetyltransferase [uncultured Cupriavidus sp.]